MVVAHGPARSPSSTSPNHDVPASSSLEVTDSSSIHTNNCNTLLNIMSDCPGPNSGPLLPRQIFFLDQSSSPPSQKASQRGQPKGTP